MSYKNDYLLTVVNKYGETRADANAELFETYDKIRDLTVSGSTMGGASLGPAAGFLMGLARLVAPASFMPILGNNSINIPGTSYSSPISGGNSILPGGTSAFGFGQLGNYPGYPTGGAAAIGALGVPLLFGIGSSLSSLASNFTVGGDSSVLSGYETGGAASIVGASSIGAVAGTGAGYGVAPSYLLPTAGVISGIGGLLTALSPYAGSFGIGSTVAGNLLQGYGGSVLSMYQQTTGRILNNADTILSEKVKNIETVVKQLDVQSDVIRKMLKDSIDADSKLIQNL
jgi:hypothetical protein